MGRKNTILELTFNLTFEGLVKCLSHKRNKKGQVPILWGLEMLN